MSTYLHVQISAETKNQADQILKSLLKKKLMTGGQIIHAPATFLWKKEIINMDYFTINSYTMEKKKEKIIKEVKRLSIEEVPMITFTPFDGNAELLKWIHKTIS